jgi:hypothetical protein
MRSILRIIAVVAFCWAVFGLLSLLSELKFVADALNWYVAHVSLALRDIPILIGQYISTTVLAYRDWVREAAALLRLPPDLPSWAYDAVGVVTFSIVRGYRRLPLEKMAVKLHMRIENFFFRLFHRISPAWIPVWAFCRLLVYGSAVAIALFMLFSFDYVYRHLA